MFINCNLRSIASKFTLPAVLKLETLKPGLLNIVLGVLLLQGVANVAAEPYLAVKNNMKCMQCHVNPIGGGARNTFGALYGTSSLPANPSDGAAFDNGAISESLRLGADLRFNWEQLDNDGGEDVSSFSTQSGQLYFVLQPKGSRFTFVVDEQIAPGSALNREAAVIMQLSGNHYLKAGTLMLPYGLRLEDDSAFIRSATGISFDNNDNGVELGLEYSKATVNFAVSDGSGSSTNDDENYQFISRAEYLGSNWRVGGSVLYNDAETGARTLYNIFGGLNLAGFILLAEVDVIEDDSVQFVPGDDLSAVVGFFEINRELKKGYNLKFTAEYFDPEDDIDENERTRYSLLLESTPYSHMQIRGGVRVGDDIPQRPQGDFTQAFMQLHLYY